MLIILYFSLCDMNELNNNNLLIFNVSTCLISNIFHYYVVRRVFKYWYMKWKKNCRCILNYLLTWYTWRGFEAVKASSAAESEISPLSQIPWAIRTIRNLIKDAVASCRGDVVGHLGHIRNESKKQFELKFRFFSFITSHVSQIFRQQIFLVSSNRQDCY